MPRIVTAARDITYPDKAGKAVVMWKQGEVVDDEVAAEMFVTYAKELVTIGKPSVVKEKKEQASELKALTVKELKDKAKNLGLKGYSSMLEDELIKAIIEAEK